ncbi:MAG: DUF1801 domain-containing protein [Rhodocyclaceae bacterium]|nr:DUF1801 domain-containing protein [Rhodocyclaceae bacterium]
MDPISDFLTSYDERVAGIVERPRKAVVRCVPDAEEQLQTGWKCITYRRGKRFCSICPHEKWVSLQFQRGAELTDAAGLLTGTGKSMRHVRIASHEAIDDGVAGLLRQASDFAL